MEVFISYCVSQHQQLFTSSAAANTLSLCMGFCLFSFIFICLILSQWSMNHGLIRYTYKHCGVCVCVCVCVCGHRYLWHLWPVRKYSFHYSFSLSTKLLPRRSHITLVNLTTPVESMTSAYFILPQC